MLGPGGGRDPAPVLSLSERERGDGRGKTATEDRPSSRRVGGRQTRPHPTRRTAGDMHTGNRVPTGKPSRPQIDSRCCRRRDPRTRAGTCRGGALVFSLEPPQARDPTDAPFPQEPRHPSPRPSPPVSPNGERRVGKRGKRGGGQGRCGRGLARKRGALPPTYGAPLTPLARRPAASCARNDGDVVRRQAADRTRTCGGRAVSSWEAPADQSGRTVGARSPSRTLR